LLSRSGSASSLAGHFCCHNGGKGKGAESDQATKETGILHYDQAVFFPNPTKPLLQ
jgi:hypothetical protein